MISDINIHKIEKSSLIKIPKKNILILYLLSIYAFLTVINASLLPSTYSFLGYIKYILLAMQLIFCLNIVFSFLGSKVSRVIATTLVLLLLFASVMYSGLNVLITTGIVVICFRKYKFENVILFLTIGQILAVLLILLAAYSGVIENLIVVRLGVERRALGFLNPNTVSNYVFSISLKTIYVLRKKFFWTPIILANICLILLMLETNSRTSLVLMILFNVMYFIYFILRIQGHSELFGKYMFIVSRVSFIGLFVLSYVVAINFSYSNPVMVEINSIFSNRISSANQFYQQYGFSALGQKVELVSTYQAAQTNSRALILDNGYLQLLIIYGILVSAIFVWYWLYLQKQIKKNNEYILLIVALIYTIYGFNSGLFLSWEYNFLLFYSLNNVQKGDKNESSYIDVSGFK